MLRNKYIKNKMTELKYGMVTLLNERLNDILISNIIKWKLNWLFDITILDVYAHNWMASKYLKQKLTDLPEETDKFLTIAENFNTSLKNWWNKVRTDTADLNIIINQLDFMTLQTIRKIPNIEKLNTYFWEIHGFKKESEEM